MRNSGQRTNTIEELISAIKANRDIAAISQIISGIEDINQADKQGRTPLWIAAKNGHTATAKLLIDRGANVNQAE